MENKNLEKLNNIDNKIDKLKTLVEILRSENGCSWDRVQTHESIKSACIEEASEVVCGINIFTKTGDPDNLKEELGDLLFQVVFHSVIAQEEGLFTLDDVIDTVTEKMVRRHPHVFDNLDLTEEEMHKLWNKIKRKEKEGKDWQEPFLKDAMEESKKLIDKAKKRKGFI